MRGNSGRKNSSNSHWSTPAPSGPIEANGKMLKETPDRINPEAAKSVLVESDRQLPCILVPQSLPINKRQKVLEAEESFSINQPQKDKKVLEAEGEPRKKKSSNKITFAPSTTSVSSLEQTVCQYLKEKDTTREGFTLEHLNRPDSFFHPEKPSGKGSQARLRIKLEEMPSLEKFFWKDAVAFRLAKVPRTQDEMQQRPTETHIAGDVDSSNEGGRRKKKKRQTQKENEESPHCNEGEDSKMLVRLPPHDDYGFVFWTENGQK